MPERRMARAGAAVGCSVAVVGWRNAMPRRGAAQYGELHGPHFAAVCGTSDVSGSRPRLTLCERINYAL